MSETQLENTKRIARNTLMLYVRMLFSMLVSLYTSRVVLNTLGVEDYGIYNVVGGVVSMMSFLSVSMSGATSRFLTFELGKKNQQGLSEAFSSSMIMYIGLSLIVLIIAETLGLWFVETKLVIPDDRMYAVRIVYQLSILSTIIGFTQVPYDASIVAHEKMDIYAYVGILSVLIRLIIAYLITLGSFDKLIFYSILSYVASIVIMIIYRSYCLCHFHETHFHFIFKKNVLKPMLAFSTYDLYGNASVIMRTQGVNILMNMFFGPVINAAAAIATQVQNAIMSFASNIITSVRPQIIKYYATEEYDSMLYLVSSSIKFTSLLLAMISIPIMIELDFILDLWLGDVPALTSTFCLYVLLFNFFVNISIILVTAIHATGNIKRPSFINGTLYLLIVPFSYIAFKLGGSAWICYLLNVFAVILGLLSNAWTINLYINKNFFKKFIFNTFMRCVLVALIAYALADITHGILSINIARFLSVFVISCLSVVLFGYYMVLSSPERKWISNFIQSKLCHRI